MYLIIHSATGHFKEKYGEKYLIIDSTEKYEEVFSRIKSEIKTINGGKELYLWKEIMQELELEQTIFTFEQIIKISNVNNNY